MATSELTPPTTEGSSVDSSRRDHVVWRVLLAVGLVACATYPLLPAGPGADLLYLVLGIAGIAGLGIGIRRFGPSSALPWWLMIAGLGCWVVGDTGYSLNEVGWLPDGSLSVADVAYLVGYLVVIVALLVFVRRRGAHLDPAPVLDSLIVAGGLGLAFYELLVRPGLADTDSTLARLVLVGYPLGDALLLAALVWVLVTPGGWTTSGKLLLSALLLLVVADVTDAVVQVYADVSLRAVQSLWLASYVLWGASGLHPSMSFVGRPLSAAPSARPSRARLVALAAAVLVAPGTLVVERLLGLPPDVWGVAVGSVVLFGLVVARMHLTAREAARSEDALTRLQTRLVHEATHDYLTGLPNRAQGVRIIENALHRARRSGDTVALLFLDLDGFKRVNDTFGHAAGDQVLVQVAHRLNAAVRGGDVVARLGGDEFVLLLEPVLDATAALAVAHRVVDDLAEPFDLDDRSSARIGASVGVAVNAELETDAEELLHYADLAAYRAKTAGKGRADLFDAVLRQAAADQASLESAIRAGVEGHELRNHYQPILRLADRSVVGYEALVRWERPGVGLVPPGEFIEVAEQSDLICDLDTWVLMQACRDVVGWREFDVPDDVYVTVNISARHLARSRVVGDVARALAETGMRADRLIVEVTETVLADELRSVEHLHALRATGVSVAIDDFGTGYSSVARLQEMPADLVKIDRCFLDDTRPGWVDVLRLIVGAAKAVGLRCVAEGVEDADQLAILTRLQCNAAQGFYIARPMPAASVPAFHRETLVG